ncbi:ABC transporter ATP-binding protein [Pollutimonas bauzanensis]|uniref:Oligopeptide transport system ATP-binding protein n=1 Tax=Pollutimonas bauzanensis TaxID=658167 RepID=A0A1M5XW77_9BURK|nr:ABC transporter ATP-binding protein [Pollutimonas bauzanensis]SHI03972.1 oligopeptide transport system ATP-binding protein [Pollutimonas bauzanensis]
MTNKLLDVQDLRVEFSGKPVVKGISFHLNRGETFGIIGESGSGKSVTALALSHLLPFNALRSSQVFRFDGADMAHASSAQIDRLRGAGWAMIFQDPSGAFNPVKRVDWHMKQVLDRVALRGRDKRADPVALLQAVGIESAQRVLHSYPFQLSGGMLQRVLIVMVAAMRPKLIIADEPTTNLDKVIENQILDLLADARRRVGATVILITHDLLVAQRHCDRIAVMYEGEFVETGTAAELLGNPRHPYTKALLESSRSLVRGDERLKEVPPGLKDEIMQFNAHAQEADHA